jgi:Hypervirulence associated proteins TUDOR domain
VANEFKRGDKVEWKFGRGVARGVVRKKLTSRTTVGNQVVAATNDDPRYLVETDGTRKQAAKRPTVLKKIT